MATPLLLHWRNILLLSLFVWSLAGFAQPKDLFVFDASSNGKNADIYSITVGAKTVTKLTRSKTGRYYHSPAVRPDGQQIAYVSERNRRKAIYLMNIDGKQPTLLVGGGTASNPAYSSDGKTIVYDDYDGMHLLKLADPKPKTITNFHGIPAGWPEFFSDNNRIAFIADDVKTHAGSILYAYDIKKNKVSTLSKTLPIIQKHLSPDGKKIVYFTRKRSDPGEIFLASLDGKKSVQLTKNKFLDASPVFSPDGKQIAFVSIRNGQSGIYTMNLDGSNQKLVVPIPQSIGHAMVTHLCWLRK